MKPDSEEAEDALVEIPHQPRQVWKTRDEGDTWPSFGETREICSIFDQKGHFVNATIRRGFHLSCKPRSQVSNDGGELVYEF